MRRIAPVVLSSAVLSVPVAVLSMVNGGVGGLPAPRPVPDSQGVPKPISKAETCGLLQSHATACFVPNLGQWNHPAKFLHRSGPMTLFVQDRGWVLDLMERPARPKARPTNPMRMPGHGDAPQKIRGVGLRMTFEGDEVVPGMGGEQKLPGHHNYFLGNDESRWRTRVPRYGSVRYRDLYPGIDLRLREVNGVPEYDLLLQPGGDLSRVNVRVEGAERLSIAADGSLVMETVLGPVVQRKPKTWQVDGDGRRREVASRFVLLGQDRFGFEAPGWDRETHLTIDPPLIWSTFLGGSGEDRALALSVDAQGVVTVVGETQSANFPTIGAYDTTFSSINPTQSDAFISRLDPSKTGKAQLVYSTFLGGSYFDAAHAVSVDAKGVVTLAGSTFSKDLPFPATGSSYSTILNCSPQCTGDGFVSRLDPSKKGKAQLVYSTFLGGAASDQIDALAVDASGVVTVTGITGLFFAASNNFPTTTNAYNATYGGWGDAFVSRLDPSKTGTAQLVYSTFLGGNSYDWGTALSLGANGQVAVVGHVSPFLTASSNFPTTSGAFSTTHNGSNDAFVSLLDPSKSGKAQLVYSTFLGGSNIDQAHAISGDPSGVVTVAGYTGSNNFPTLNAYDTTLNGGTDAFVVRLLLQNVGSKGLVYSTFLGGSKTEIAFAVSDVGGVVTVAGDTDSSDFPTTIGAHDKTYNGGSTSGDVFVSRLDPTRFKTAQLVYSTFLGGSGDDHGSALFVDVAGVATLAGNTVSTSFPTTGTAYDTTYNGGQNPLYGDAFVSRLSMGVAFHADRYEVSLQQGGVQTLQLDAGKQQAGRSYAIFGSVTGTQPGITLLGIPIPLNPDPYTAITIAMPNANPPFQGFRGVLDSNGVATAAFNVPSTSGLLGFTLYHAYLVHDNSGKIHMGSNAVPLKLR